MVFFIVQFLYAYTKYTDCIICLPYPPPFAHPPSPGNLSQTGLATNSTVCIIFGHWMDMCKWISGTVWKTSVIIHLCGGGGCCDIQVYNDDNFDSVQFLFWRKHGNFRSPIHLFIGPKQNWIKLNTKTNWDVLKRKWCIYV